MTTRRKNGDKEGAKGEGERSGKGCLPSCSVLKQWQGLGQTKAGELDPRLSNTYDIFL